MFKKAQIILQGDLTAQSITRKVAITTNVINQIRNLTMPFEHLTLTEIEQLAAYFDIYGPSTESFTDQRLFLISYVMSRSYFYNGELEIIVRDNDHRPRIFAVIITNPIQFIDSIITHHPFYQLLTEFAELPRLAFQRQLKRHFICNIHLLVQAPCQGYQLRHQTLDITKNPSNDGSFI